MAAVLNPFVGQELGILLTEISTADLEALADFIEDGTIQLVIDWRYTLQETPEAISYLETGSGKVVITVTYHYRRTVLASASTSRRHRMIQSD